MAAYNEVAFTAANGSRYAFMRLYEAGQSAVENRTYNALFPLNSTRPAGGYKVGAYSLAGAAVADTEKQLHLRLAEAQSVAPGADGVVVEFLDTDDFYLSSGMARSDRPLYYTGTDGKRYSIWLDSASTDTDGVTHAQLSMYRIG
jgi:hypothetical protein